MAEAAENLDTEPTPETDAAPAPAETAAEAEREPASQPAWPADWQAQISGGDEKLGKLAQRYASPREVLNALAAAQTKIRSGELKSALPKDATPEQLAAWREDNGIPADPKGYTLPDGVVVGEDEREGVDGFLAAAHEANMTPEQAQKALGWYYDFQQKQRDEIEAADRALAETAQDELYAEWGENYRSNLNRAKNFLRAKFPEDVQEALLNARLGDGKPLMSTPGILRALVQMDHEFNPAGTVVPGGGDPIKGIESEIAEIEKTMRTNRAEYNRNEKMQARYRELLEVRERIKR